ncbi:unnamed protein product [Absidia cylindrospora]
MNLYQQPERHLVQFNAGKCIREGNMLKPDLRKGMIYMDQGNDQLMHFYWKERKYNSEPEDDLIIFPDEAELQKVPECTTGRVLVLKYKTSNQQLFFWMQKLDSDLDDTVIQRVNQLINDPSSALDDAQMDLDSSDHSIEMELMQRLMGSAGEGNLTEENLMELFQQAESLSDPNHADDSDNDTTNATVRPQTETASDTTTTGNQPPSQPEQTQQQEQEQEQESQPAPSTTESIDPEHYEQFRSMLANIQQQSQGKTSLLLFENVRSHDNDGGFFFTYQIEQSSSTLQLGDVLTTQTLTALLSDPQVCDGLYSCLPDNTEQTPTEVQQVAQSPQFQQALHSLSTALQSGQLGPLLTQLGLDPSAGNGVEAFLKAIEDQARRKDEDTDAMDQD